MKFKSDDNRQFLGFEPAPKPFTGRLEVPIVRRNEFELAFENFDEEVQTEFEKESGRIYAERQQRLELLFEHYVIPPASSEAKRWKNLAYALACDFVRGMQVLKRAPRKRGAPKKWKGGVRQHLVEVVESILHERKKGIHDAVRTARKRYPEAWPKITTDKSLATRYHEARKIISDSKTKRPQFLD
jgi:hypothetical protein